MKTTKLIKKVIILMVVFLIIFIPSSNANSYDIEGIIQQGDGFLNLGKEEAEKTEDEEGNPITPPMDTAELKKQVGYMYGVLFALGVSISVIVGAILGIKYMVSSVDEQAKIKETLIPYALGCIVVFGAFGIWKIAMEIGGTMF